MFGSLGSSPDSAIEIVQLRGNKFIRERKNESWI